MPRKTIHIKRQIRRIVYLPTRLMEGAGWHMQLNRMKVGWGSRAFVSYLKKEKVRPRRLRVHQEEATTVLHSNCYMGLASTIKLGAPSDQNLTEGFISSLKSTARKYKHHIDFLPYLRATATTLRTWVVTPGIQHSICGSPERQSLFPLPVRGRMDISPEFLNGPGKPMKLLGAPKMLPAIPRILNAQKYTGHAIVEVDDDVWMMRRWLPAGAVNHAHVAVMLRLLAAESTEEIFEIW